MKAKPYRVTDGGRVRDARGRYVSATRARDIADAIAGKITESKSKGRTIFRATSGRIVGADVLEMQRGGAKRTIREGGGKRRVADLRPVHVDPVAQPADLWKGRKVVKGQLYGQSAPKLVDDNAATGRTTMVKFRGKLSRVRPEDSGRLSDSLRVLLSDYVNAFHGLQDSPHMKVGFLETTAGDILDLDDISTLDDEVMDELLEDPRAQRAALKFNAAVDRTGSRLVEKVQPKKHAHKKASKGPPRTGERGGLHRPTGKGRKKR